MVAQINASLKKIKLKDFNNLTKTLSFNIYDICFAATEDQRKEYISYIDEEYNAARLTKILTDVANMIGASILNIAHQDYDPQGASVTMLISEEPMRAQQQMNNEETPGPLLPDAVVAHLDLKDAVHVGHSTGGGEVVHFIARHGESRVAKAAIISAVPPLMVKTPANPGGLPKDVFDGLQAQLAANRSQFYRDLPAGPFYGFNRPGARSSEATIQNWWRQGMMGGAKAHYDGIVAFSQTDFTEDLKKITIPVLVMHSEDDQIVPYADAGPLSAKLLRNGTLKTYKDFPHGMPTTHAETINAELLAFIKG